MLFAHDTEVALAAASALVNTESRDGELLPDLATLNEFFDDWGWTGRRPRTNSELDDVHALRARLRSVWRAAMADDVDEAVRVVNALLTEANALPQLVKHDGWDYHLHATSSDAPLAERMAVEAGMGFVDVIRAGEFGRLRVCAAPDCDDVYVDLSKNRSRRFCDGTCGNRTNVAAYRARRAGTS
jgi:predicted RNA-binding Zn ribbon-like protein